MKERPRRGGVGFRLVTVGGDGHEDTWDSDLPGYLGATNNAMELQACILALKLLAGKRSPVDGERFSKIVLHTDSQYVHKNLPIARSRWGKQGWTRASGPPVVNGPLWKELLALERRSALPVRFDWVPGKSSVHTKAADKLAKTSADRPTALPLSGSSPARKLTEKSTDIGSVPMLGQVLDIRIVSGDYERLAKFSRYRYEIVAGDLEGEIDVATSDLHLRRNHSYRVQMNEDRANPRIEVLLEELEIPTA
jgi:ribonuclease HI